MGGCHPQVRHPHLFPDQVQGDEPVLHRPQGRRALLLHHRRAGHHLPGHRRPRPIRRLVPPERQESAQEIAEGQSAVSGPARYTIRRSAGRLRAIMAWTPADGRKMEPLDRFGLGLWFCGHGGVAMFATARATASHPESGSQQRSGQHSWRRSVAPQAPRACGGLVVIGRCAEASGGPAVVVAAPPSRPPRAPLHIATSPFRPLARHTPHIIPPSRARPWPWSRPS